MCAPAGRTSRKRPAGAAGNPEGRATLAAWDIGLVYRLLNAAGMSQGRVCDLTGMRQSKVHEVLAGRQVSAYDVLVWIAHGPGVRAGGYTSLSPTPAGSHSGSCPPGVFHGEGRLTPRYVPGLLERMGEGTATVAALRGDTDSKVWKRWQGAQLDSRQFSLSDVTLEAPEATIRLPD